jgi:hypothetical protein
MTELELEAYRKYHTQKALDNLRDHLKKNSDEQKRTTGLLYDDGKLKEAELLERFVDGSYEGRPIKSVLLTNSNVFRFGGFRLKVFICLLLFFILVFFILFTHKFRFEGILM